MWSIAAILAQAISNSTLLTRVSSCRRCTEMKPKPSVERCGCRGEDGERSKCHQGGTRSSEAQDHLHTCGLLPHVSLRSSRRQPQSGAPGRQGRWGSHRGWECWWTTGVSPDRSSASTSRSRPVQCTATRCAVGGCFGSSWGCKRP